MLLKFHGKVHTKIYIREHLIAVTLWNWKYEVQLHSNDKTDLATVYTDLRVKPEINE